MKKEGIVLLFLLFLMLIGFISFGVYREIIKIQSQKAIIEINERQKLNQPNQ